MVWRIIGNMTGNSMDAIDLVLTEFDEDKMKDICFYSKPYTKQMQQKMEKLRFLVANKTKNEILSMADFKCIHDEYVFQIANCINEMCLKNNIDKDTIDAIGFHGKTLDHNPPSRAKAEGTKPYTLQIGSGKMLACLTGMTVVYDFRSAPLMAGFDGAPLVPPHNAHIAISEGDGCYYNGGNTSNFAWIINGVAQLGTDAGPCNEYIDNFIREKTEDTFDIDGKYGKKGSLHKEVLQEFFNIGRSYYERALPKSGDPQYYHKEAIFDIIKSKNLSVFDAVYTLEYFAAYIAVHALTLTDEKLNLPSSIILFGGGWKNPIVREVFETLLMGKGFVLEEHRKQFERFLKRFSDKLTIRYSQFGEMMEARLFADLARYRLENRVWEIPEIIKSGKNIVCGNIAVPYKNNTYDDMISVAAKGWDEA